MSFYSDNYFLLRFNVRPHTIILSQESGSGEGMITGNNPNQTEEDETHVFQESSTLWHKRALLLSKPQFLLETKTTPMDRASEGKGLI